MDLENSIDKAVKFLISKQNSDGSISLNSDKRWNVWETANAVITIKSVKNNEKKFIKKAVNFLLKIQRDDGSFYHTISYKPNEYCMETTPICTLALWLDDKDVEKSISFILDKQESNGSWEIGTPEIIKRRYWPSITGFVINTLLRLNMTNEKISKGIDYLLVTQLEDGSWGSNWVYYDTPFYPMHTILSSLNIYGLDESDYYKKGINFILKNQNKKGFWSIIKKDKPRPSEALRSALALNCLIISPKKTYFKSINKGIDWLLSKQKSDGSWDGGYFVNWPGKKEDIYTTCIALQAINDYKKII